MQEDPAPYTNLPALFEAQVGVEAQIDVSKLRSTGVSRVSIIDPGGVHLDVKNDGDFIKYTSYTPGLHRVNIKLNDKHIPGSPFCVNITKGASSSASGPGLSEAHVGTEAHFTVSKKPGRAMVVDILGPSGVNTFRDDTESEYIVKYTPTQCGNHVIIVYVDSQHIPGSPFSVHVSMSDPQVPTTTPETQDTPETPKTEDCDDYAEGPGLLSPEAETETKLFVKSKTNNDPQRYYLVSVSNGVYLKTARVDVHDTVFAYTPPEAGVYTISVKRGGLHHITGSPFSVNVVSPGTTSSDLSLALSQKDTATGPGLVSAKVGQDACFQIIPASGPVGKFLVRITMENGMILAGSKITHYPGLRINYVPQFPGRHSITVLRDLTHHICGSPFSVDVTRDDDCLLVPASSIHDVLMSYEDMPLDLFTTLAKQLLSQNKKVNPQLILDNLSRSPEKVRVLLKAGISTLFDNVDTDVFSVSWPSSLRESISQYLLELSGEDLLLARTAFQRSPNTLPIPEDIELLKRVCLHLKVVPDTVCDSSVLWACAQEGIFRAGSSLEQVVTNERIASLTTALDVANQKLLDISLVLRDTHSHSQ